MTGLARWYDAPPPAVVGPTWGEVLERWPLVEADLHQLYGIDVWDEALMAARPWSWLRSRIAGLLTANSRTARAFTPLPGSARAAS